MCRRVLWDRLLGPPLTVETDDSPRHDYPSPETRTTPGLGSAPLHETDLVWGSDRRIEEAHKGLVEDTIRKVFRTDWWGWSCSDPTCWRRCKVRFGWGQGWDDAPYRDETTWDSQINK